jgi:hypothetical protein
MRYIILIYSNKDAKDKNLTVAAADEQDEIVICCGIGCNAYPDSNITLTAGTRIFNFKVCQNCKKKLDN